MIQQEVQINNKTGLHARPASEFVKEANKYKSNVKVQYNGKELNGKSIISILSGGISKGARIMLIIDGEDEKIAAKALMNLLTSLED